MDKELKSAEELQAEAARFARSLAPLSTGATLVTLSGELGAGKTTFTQALASALGVTETVTSPTFVLEKIYDLPEGDAFARLAHIDAYRLEGEGALGPLGFQELMKDTGTLVVLEWPEMVASDLPKSAHALMLTVMPDNTRTLSYA